MPASREHRERSVSAREYACSPHARLHRRSLRRRLREGKLFQLPLTVHNSQTEHLWVNARVRHEG